MHRTPSSTQRQSSDAALDPMRAGRVARSHEDHPRNTQRTSGFTNALPRKDGSLEQAQERVPTSHASVLHFSHQSERSHQPGREPRLLLTATAHGQTQARPLPTLPQGESPNPKSGKPTKFRILRFCFRVFDQDFGGFGTGF